MNKLILLFLILSACAKPDAAPTCTGKEVMAAATGQPSVLVIGDSISIGYTPTLKASLTNYDVVHNPCNAMTSTWTLQHVDKWLDSRTSFEAITWNNGLWDVADWISTPSAEYVSNLHHIAQKIKAKTAHPLFLTSTQVLPGTPNRVDANGVAFNVLAVQVMQSEGIPVLDLYSVSATIQVEHVTPTDPHFTPAGYQILGNAVLSELNTLYGVN